MKELVFILIVMNGNQEEGQITYRSIDKCKWYAEKINREVKNLVGNYSAMCKPVIRNKVEE